jgi:hypothetical protein
MNSAYQVKRKTSRETKQYYERDEKYQVFAST